MSSGALIFEAATVVLLRPPLVATNNGGNKGADKESENRADFEVCMVRRSSKSQFMPDAVVFPGGRVDPEDSPKQGDPELRFAQAARRECMEEVNLDVQALALHWFDTWKTPSGEGPKRFLARFFMTRIDRDTSLSSQADEHETHDLQWAPPSHFLELAQHKKLILAPPTFCVLSDLDQLGPEALMARSAQECAQIILPKVRLDSEDKPNVTAKDSKRGRDVIMPHHPEYPSLAGDSAPAPERALRHPRCFRYQDSFYVPKINA